MQTEVVGSFDGWRALARERLASAVRPDEVVWSDERRPSLFGGGGACESGGVVSTAATPTISREVLGLLEMLACYRDPGRWDLMYRLAWRVIHENRALLENDADPDVRTARLWSKAVSQDVHKMHAFLRFHETAGEDGVP